MAVLLVATLILFQRGADFTTAMAFMFASSNLVIELGILLSCSLVGSSHSRSLLAAPSSSCCWFSSHRSPILGNKSTRLVHGCEPKDSIPMTKASMQNPTPLGVSGSDPARMGCRSKLRDLGSQADLH